MSAQASASSTGGTQAFNSSGSITRIQSQASSWTTVHSSEPYYRHDNTSCHHKYAEDCIHPPEDPRNCVNVRRDGPFHREHKSSPNVNGFNFVKLLADGAYYQTPEHIGFITDYPGNKVVWKRKDIAGRENRQATASAETGQDAVERLRREVFDVDKRIRMGAEDATDATGGEAGHITNPSSLFAFSHQL